MDLLHPAPIHAGTADERTDRPIRMGVRNAGEQGEEMNSIIKRTLIALGLIAFCSAVLAATKSYGVWVISAIAIGLFIVGMLRGEKTAADNRDRESRAVGPPQEDDAP